MNKKNDFVISTVYKGFFFATIVGKLSATLCTTLNSIIVGQFLGESQLAVLTLLSPLFTVCSAFSYLLAVGAGFLCAHYMGNNQQKEINNMFSVTVIAAGVLGMLFTVLFFGGAPLLVRLLGAREENLVRYAVLYLRGYSFGMIPYFLNSLLVSLISLNSSKDLVVKSTVVLGAMGVVADFIMLVLGFDMIGIGIATSISYFCALLVDLLHFRRPVNVFHFMKPFSAAREVAACVRRGALQGFFPFLDMLESIIKNRIILSVVGSAGLAAMTVYSSVQSIVMIFSLGGCSCMANMISMFYEERDKRAITATIRTTLRYLIAFTGTGSAILLLIPGVICRIYGINDPGTMTYGIAALRILAVVMFVSIFFWVFTSVQEALGRNVFTISTNLINTFLFTIPWLFICTRLFGVIGIWLTSLISYALSIILFMIIAWKRTGSFTKIAEWPMYPKNYSDEGAVLAFYMDKDKDTYFQNVNEIAVFCIRHGLDRRMSNHIMLMAEENSSLILENSRRKKEYENIDCRLLIQGEELNMRFRYVGKPYNLMAEEKLQDSLEMKLIQSLSDTIDYQYAMDINHLVFYMKKTAPVRSTSLTDA